MKGHRVLKGAAMAGHLHLPPIGIAPPDPLEPHQGPPAANGPRLLREGSTRIRHLLERSSAAWVRRFKASSGPVRRARRRQAWSPGP